jgi:osmotically-inducible protein OsmY
VANHNQNGRDVALPEDSQPSWRPQDDLPAHSRDRDDDRDYRGWQDGGYRDEDRYGERDVRGGAMRSSARYREDREARERSTERYGQGQSGYTAGRRGDERWQPPSRERRASAGSFEDRNHDLGVDDRFTGRGPGYWQDRTGYDSDRVGLQGGYRGRDFEPERHDLARSGHRDERLGYPAGSYARGRGGPAEDLPRRDLDSDPHVHRGTGPHRGKGPIGYERSDERIRELVCESLADDDQIDASRVEVSVNRGEVTLSGTIDGRRAKRDAEDCAASVSGVRDVQNLLRVAEPPATRDNPSGQRSVGKLETEAPAYDKKQRA